jgi:hypothetical protein
MGDKYLNDLSLHLSRVRYFLRIVDEHITLIFKSLIIKPIAIFHVAT